MSSTKFCMSSSDIASINFSELHSSIAAYAASKGVHDPDNVASLTIERALCSTFQGDFESFRRFVFKIAYYRIVDQYREMSRVTFCELLDYDNPTEDDVESLDISVFESLKSALSQFDYSLLVLRHVEGLDMNELSDIFNKSEATLRVSLHRATKRAKHALDSCLR